MVDGLFYQGCSPEVTLDDPMEPRLLGAGQFQLDFGAASRRGGSVERSRYETPVRCDKRPERRARVVHDLGPSPQLTDRRFPLRRRQRRPRLVEVLAANLRAHDPAVALGSALSKDLWVPDLSRKSPHERNLACHVDGCMRDPHGDAVTNPRRVRVPIGSLHSREFATKVSRHLSGQAPDKGCADRVTILVERMNTCTGLFHSHFSTIA